MVQLVTLDFETYYDKDYSLSKITMEEYIRSPAFQIIGVGFALGDDEPHWVSFATIDEYAHYFKFLNGCMVLCHNTLFDGAILSWVLDIHPAFLLDTLCMARPIHGNTTGCSLKKLADHYKIGEKGTEVHDALGKRRETFTTHQLDQYGGYCKNDVVLTRKIFDILKVGFPKDELKLINRTLKLFTEPILELDLEVLTTHLWSVQEKKDALLAKVAEIAGPDVLRSSNKLATLLGELGVDPPMKPSPTAKNPDGTPKQTYAFSKTDKEFVALLDHDDERVQAVVSARLGTKSTIEESRTKRFISVASRGAFPVPLHYAGAFVTSRWSGADKMNLQNLPRGGALRHAIVAPDGYLLVDADSANIELRVNHALAGQVESVESFKQKRDLYCEFASVLYNRPITKKEKAERQVGKLAQLSLGYGCGWAKFQEICRLNKVIISEADAMRIVKLWRDTYEKIPELWRRADKAIRSIYAGEKSNVDPAGLVKTCPDGFKLPSGRLIRYPGLTMGDDGWEYRNQFETVKLYGAKADENICQSLARDIMGDQWLVIADRYRVVLQVHDELVVCVPEKDAEECKQYIVEVMSTSPKWWPTIPLSADASIGKSYGDVK